MRCMDGICKWGNYRVGKGASWVMVMFEDLRFGMSDSWRIYKHLLMMMKRWGIRSELSLSFDSIRFES